MARFIIENKVYDTDNMDRVGLVKKWYEHESYFLRQLWGRGVGKIYDCELYRSKKGNWLITHENDCGNICGEAITESTAKELLLQSNYAVYEKLYGALEEA